MSGTRLELLPGLLNMTSGIAVLATRIWNPWLISQTLAINKVWVKVIGASLVLLGITLFSWSAMHINNALLGEVKPVLNNIVTTGPYQFIRHPVYLGITTSLIGLALSFDSLASLLLVFLLFLPSVIFRAKLEERVLKERFNKTWEQYTKTTGFLLPKLTKNHE